MPLTFSPFDAASALIVAAAILGYANHRWLGLPSSVGLTVMGALASLLVWGGLRGGISVALALSLPDSPIRAAILAATYIVVLFAVIVQGAALAL